MDVEALPDLGITELIKYYREQSRPKKISLQLSNNLLIKHFKVFDTVFYKRQSLSKLKCLGEMT